MPRERPISRFPARAAARLSALAACLALGAAPALANNGIHLSSQSTKAVGRGGTEAAIGNDVLTSIANPATLVEADDMRIDSAFGVFIERVRSTDRFKDDLTTQTIPVAAFGIVFDPWRSDPGPDGEPAVSSRARVAFTFWQPVTLMFSPTFSFAYRLTDTLSFGVAVHPIYTNLNLQIQGHQGGGDPNAPPDFLPAGKINIWYRPDGTPVRPPEPFDAGTGTQVTWNEVFTLANNTSGPQTAPAPSLKIDLKEIAGFGIGGQLGFLWTPLPELGIGLSWRTPAVIFNPRGKGTIDLNEAVEAIKANPTVGQLLTAAFETYLPDRGKNGYKAEYDAEADDLILPQIFTLGAAFMPVPRWLLSADFRFINWRGASSEIIIKGSQGSNPDFNEINGGPGLEYVVKLDWRDSYIVALGTAVEVYDRFVLRAGFNYGTNPVTDNYLLGNSLSTTTHVTFGAGYSFAHLELDFAYMYGLPTQVSEELAQMRSSSEQHWVFVGVGYRF